MSYPILINAIKKTEVEVEISEDRIYYALGRVIADKLQTYNPYNTAWKGNKAKDYDRGMVKIEGDVLKAFQLYRELRNLLKSKS
jgi:hypothetical protein